MKDIQETRKLIYEVIHNTYVAGLWKSGLTTEEKYARVDKILKWCGIIYIPKDQEIDSNVRNRN